MYYMTWYTSMCDITVMRLLYRLYNIVKCVCCMGLGSNDCFIAGTALTGGHYRTYINSGVSHPRSCLIVPLMLYMVVNNIRGIDVVLQVSQDNTNPAKKLVKSWVNYT